MYPNEVHSTFIINIYIYDCYYNLTGHFAKSLGISFLRLFNSAAWDEGRQKT